jgi:hypothetical protein
MLDDHFSEPRAKSRFPSERTTARQKIKQKESGNSPGEILTFSNLKIFAFLWRWISSESTIWPATYDGEIRDLE